ncbi:hypothetical protein CUU80_10455 [Bifidobacterium scaligerum]|uniref:Uncharacterized protein n=1 Tax=Bifidobacterium scaligerum TaxID=2052656 RepID=A0A2M9HN60_9BIFI|nr:hypothetical protein CUU80_10455 [Bifidobacterium scaligerum]
MGVIVPSQPLVEQIDVPASGNQPLVTEIGSCYHWLVACGLWLVACGLWLVACGLWLVACAA